MQRMGIEPCDPYSISADRLRTYVAVATTNKRPTSITLDRPTHSRRLQWGSPDCESNISIIPYLQCKVKWVIIRI